MGKSTTMTLGKLKSLDSKKFTSKKLIIDNFEVNVDEQFRNSKLMDLVQEFTQQSLYAKDKDIMLNPANYLLILEIKYFTDIDISDEYEKQIQTLSILCDLESDGKSYIDIISEAFNEEELKKLNKKLLEGAERLQDLVKELEEEKAKEEQNKTEESIDVESTEITE